MPSSAARWRTQRAEFSLYTTASKKSIGKLHKKSCFGSPEIVQLFSKKFLTSGACGGILFTEVKRGTPKGFQKDFEKNRKNLLTNSARHDIIGTEVKGKRFLKRRKATVKKLPKNFKKPLDKPSEKCYNESTRKPNAPWKVNISLRYQTSESLKRSSKNLLTNRRKYDIIKSQKDKDSPKHQKGFEYGKDQQDSYHQGYAFRGH